MPLDPARAADEAIRKLNHATIAPKRPIPAPAISATMQALVHMVDRMPQALEQLGHQLQVGLTEDAIRMDTGEQPAAPVAEVLGALDDAATALRALSTALHRAASPLFQMAAQ